MTPIRVALVGGTGNIGTPILNAFLSTPHPITVLTRRGSKSINQIAKRANISVEEVDFESVQSLTAAVCGHTAVVSTVAITALASQKTLIDACIAAEVPRFIPSEFGSNTLNSRCAQLPVSRPKVEIINYLKSAVKEHPSFSYSLIMTGAFLDWGLSLGFMVDIAKHSAVLLDGGDNPYSATRLSTVGAAVVGVVEHLPETANRAVYVQDACITQNQLIELAKERDGKEWTLKHASTDVLLAQSLAELSKSSGDTRYTPAAAALNTISVYGKDFGGDWSNQTSNELLGLPGMSEQELKELVWSFLP